MSESLFYARRSMTYGRPGNERQIDRGQVFDLQGCVNDEKLLRLGYVVSAPKRATVVQCGTCGAEFITDEGLAAHGRERHATTRSLTPREEDDRADKKLAIEDEIAPLDLTKTAASRGYARTK